MQGVSWQPQLPCQHGLTAPCPMHPVEPPMRSTAVHLEQRLPSPSLRGTGAAESVHARDDLSCRERPHAPRRCNGPASCGQLGGDQSGVGRSLATGRGRPLVLGIRCQVHHIGAHGRLRTRAGINRVAGAPETTCSSWAGRGTRCSACCGPGRAGWRRGCLARLGTSPRGRGAVRAAAVEARAMVRGRWRAPGPGTQVSTVALHISTHFNAAQGRQAAPPPGWTIAPGVACIALSLLSLVCKCWPGFGENYCFIALDFVPARLIHRLVLLCSDDTVSSLESARGCPGST